MFNKIRLKEILAEYKKVFVQQQWPNEKCTMLSRELGY